MPFPVITADYSPIAGPVVLLGWSVREATDQQTQDNEGSVTSPGAGQTIVTLAGLPAGTYNVGWSVELAGTLAAADSNNFRLTDTGGDQLGSINLAVAGSYPQVSTELTIATGQSISIVAIAAGTVGAVYSAQLSIEPVIIDDVIAEIRDGNQILGCISLGTGQASTLYFGIPGMSVMNGITVHIVTGTLVGVVYCLYDD